MGDKFMIWLVHFVFYCECQFPINRPFTDEFSPTAPRIRSLTEATDRRILNQFQNQPPSNRHSQNIDGIFSDTFTVNNNVIRHPGVPSTFNRELVRMGMRNIGSIDNRFTNEQMPVLSRQNPESAGLVDLTIAQNLNPIVSGNRHSNSHTRGRAISVDRQNIQINNVTQISGNREITPELSFTQNHHLTAPTLSQGQLTETVNGGLQNENAMSHVGSINNDNSNTDTMISEAELLQMGTNELSALGRHGISLNSIVDTNFDTVGTPSNSSTEEQLIIALLERLIELQESRQPPQISSSSAPLSAPFPDTNVNPETSGTSTLAQTSLRPISRLQKQLFGIFSEGRSNLFPMIGQTKHATNSKSSVKLQNEDGHHQQILVMPQRTTGSFVPTVSPQVHLKGTSSTIDIKPPTKSHQKIQMGQQTNVNFHKTINNEKELTSVFTKQKSPLDTSGMHPDRTETSINTGGQLNSEILTNKVTNGVLRNEGTNVIQISNPLQLAIQSIPCQFRGCATGHYCVTIALSELYADFCAQGSSDPCKCSPGCNFQNKFLPENAVERLGRCRKCFCENGVVYCRFTRRCRIIYRMMRFRRNRKTHYSLLNVK